MNLTDIIRTCLTSNMVNKNSVRNIISIKLGLTSSNFIALYVQKTIRMQFALYFSSLPFSLSLSLSYLLVIICILLLQMSFDSRIQHKKWNLWSQHATFTTHSIHIHLCKKLNPKNLHWSSNYNLNTTLQHTLGWGCILEFHW